MLIRLFSALENSKYFDTIKDRIDQFVMKKDVLISKKEKRKHKQYWIDKDEAIKVFAYFWKKAKSAGLS